MSRNPLRRSRHHRILAGVCGGIADWLGWRATTVRILYVLLSVLSAAFPGILVYLVLWLVVPRASRRQTAYTV
ncbi:MAG: PspC domain-containing protein [Acidobacteria bacterium]|nr:PspC domain-containing protein [Acidobacteriota bacterium]